MEHHMKEHKSSHDKPRRRENAYAGRHGGQNNTHPDKAEREGKKEMHSNPDRGPAMEFGQHHFDKGYESDADVWKRKESYPGDEQRGNDYRDANREIITRDSTKMRRQEFSKIH